MNLGWPAGVLETLGGVSDLLARLPEIERSVGETAARVQSVLEGSQASLDGILERLGPVEGEVEELRSVAASLDSRMEGLGPQLRRLEQLIDPLERRFVELTEAANRLDGGLVHVLDRVPGLSADDARERAETPN